jgi:acyl carrier protein
MNPEGKDAIEKKTIEIIGGIFGVAPGKISRGTRFTEDLHAKSIDIIALLAALEGEFKIEIPSPEVQESQTVGQAVDYIEKKLKN